MRTINKIVTCIKCEGAGTVNIEYFKSSRDPEVDTCPTCHGEGRLIRTITIEEKPFSGSIKPTVTLIKNED